MIDPLTLPKAELHLHIEGTLEPELMFELARRNGVSLPYADTDAVRRAYRFGNLQSFLDVYYRACSVLIHERDFYELTIAYLNRARAQGVRHVEVFFDPQTHIQRGVRFDAVVGGIGRALTEARGQGVTSQLIMCFLRDLPADDAMATLEQSLAHRDVIFGVGLDSAEVGNPPRKFREVFERAVSAGFRAVAHAGEEGPPDYIWQALDLLGAERIDHGVRCLEDRSLVRRLEADRIPLTVCPFSNVKLRVVETWERSSSTRWRTCSSTDCASRSTPMIPPTSAVTSARTSPTWQEPCASTTARSSSSLATASKRRSWMTPPGPAT